MGHLLCLELVRVWKRWMGFRKNACGTDNMGLERECWVISIVSLVLKQGAILPPVTIWQCLETILIVTLESVYLPVCMCMHAAGI